MRTYPKIVRNRKERIRRRLNPRKWEDQPEPMFQPGTITYEVSGKQQGMNYGGIGALHQMISRLGLVKEIDQNLHLLTYHVPYHESDHVLNIAYNVALGATRLEDIELRRQDEVFLNAIGAQRIPDPTTAGDFTRRFKETDIVKLMECFNATRRKVWDLQSDDFLEEAVIDVDGTIAPTLGRCKEGMDISYKGIWGYCPLIVSLANTREILYMVNRPGNRPSHCGSAEWIDRAIDLVSERAERICVRGDTDFSLTGEFDRWSEKTDFVFGMDASPNLVDIAEGLEKAAWKPLERRPGPESKTGQERDKPTRYKDEIVKERKFKVLRLQGEEVAEVEYSPGKCENSYRLIIVRKNITHEKGEVALLDEIRYHFYITTIRDRSATQVVRFAHQRCDQENVIEQLKNGVNALRMPVNDLKSNWAYMVIASLAWNMKAWFSMLMPDREAASIVGKMEYRRFLHSIVLLPAQIIRKGRRTIYRLLGYNSWLPRFLETWERIRRLPVQRA